ncbi:Panacea domain-containing protein [Phyllobacterium sp. SB3]|uniref:Panacea domain-containing protein n=1 Tax=Phyllobacterium sp. SB3 TaxID=3156073 RepID=UPI0032AFBD81
MLLPGYDVAKAAQAVVFFATKAGGAINVLKLAKLLYLSEREFLTRYDEPMFYDRLAALPDGPVTSVTLNLINGHLEDPVWQKFVAARAGYDIAPAQGVSSAELTDLSKADLEVLDAIWAKFGSFDKYKLRDWTHKPENVPEWKDPNGSSNDISYQSVFEHLHKDDPSLLIEHIKERRALSAELAKSA